MSVKALQEYTRYAKYAQYKQDKQRRETWSEQVDRVFDMHEKHLGDKLQLIQDDFDFAKSMVQKKRVLGSQRALQFGGKAILDKNARMYNCTVSYVDRPRFFQECFYLLLCGCGAGFSVQKHHVDRLPSLSKRSKESKTFVVADSIEGWSDALGVLLASYWDYEDVEFGEYRGHKIDFDFSQIRPAGAPLSWGGKAPGPDGLSNALNKIEELIEKRLESGTTLRPIDAYDITMHASDAVLSGGIRRSATICLFSYDDEEMITAKTGSWFIDNPQRGRSNNSAVLVRNEITKDEFDTLMVSVREFGEPGFVWAENREALYNPCVEIGMWAYWQNDGSEAWAKEAEKSYQVIDVDGEQCISGWQFCNLTEQNMRRCKTEEDFYDACKAAAILGTIQASYNWFDYLGLATHKIVSREALLGCSMTGMMDSPEIAFDPEIQQRGAKLILDINEKIAEKLGINKCARATCVKPAGSTSCVLGSASGVHPHHAKRYIRRVQANKMEFPAQYFQAFNPMAVEDSVWSANGTDVVLSFCCEVPDGAKTKNQIGGLELLEYVRTTQQNWVKAGTREEACTRDWLRHNVSNTITVKPEEWQAVGDFIYENRRWFAGISLLPFSGDLDYPQAPFVAIHTPAEIVREYGEGSLMASGLIVDGLRAFGGNLWAACDCALGFGESLDLTDDEKKLTNGKLKAVVDSKYVKSEWVRRAKQFADRYCQNDLNIDPLKRATHLMKCVHNWKLWCDLNRDYKDIDWNNVIETDYEVDMANMSAGAACSGGACELGELGESIAASKETAGAA